MSSPLSFKYHQLCWVLPKFLFFPFISYLLLRYAAFRKTPQRCCSCKQLSTCLFAFLQAEDLSSGACCDLRATQKRTIHKLTVCHLQLYGDHMTAGCFAYRYLNSQDFFFSWSHLYLQTINSLIRKVQQIGPQSYVNLTSDWYFISHCVWLWVYVTQTITTL